MKLYTIFWNLPSEVDRQLLYEVLQTLNMQKYYTEYSLNTYISNQIDAYLKSLKQHLLNTMRQSGNKPVFQFDRDVRIRYHEDGKTEVVGFLYNKQIKKRVIVKNADNIFKLSVIIEKEKVKSIDYIPFQFSDEIELFIQSNKFEVKDTIPSYSLSDLLVNVFKRGLFSISLRKMGGIYFFTDRVYPNVERIVSVITSVFSNWFVISEVITYEAIKGQVQKELEEIFLSMIEKFKKSKSRDALFQKVDDYAEWFKVWYPLSVEAQNNEQIKRFFEEDELGRRIRKLVEVKSARKEVNVI